MDLWDIENNLHNDGFLTVAGVDEAGRGPLAGPVYAAAVILPHGHIIKGLDDSKKLTEKKREELFDVIVNESLAFGIDFASYEEVDELNILKATFLAMNRAIRKLFPTPDICIIDGNRSAGIEYKNICVVRGDSRCASVAAASVLAKVSRDRYMLEQSEKYPEYGFSKHKGYGTKLHYEKLREFGPSPIHRVTFLEKMH